MSGRGGPLPLVPPAALYGHHPPSVHDPPGTLIEAIELAAPEGMRGWAVLYGSLGAGDVPIGVSGLVLAPAAAAREAPILAWAHGTAGLADACAPSRAGFGHPAAGALLSLAALGFTVTATDYEGLGTPGLHPYLVGPSEGRAVLDSIRATKQLTGVPSGAPSAVMGISQGGHAALWSAECAPAYAPELPIAGVVAASPPIDLLATRTSLVGSARWTPAAWLDSLMVAVAWSDHFGFDLEGRLTEEGERVAQALRTEALETVALPSSDPFRSDPGSWPEWPALAEANSPGHAASRAPILMLAATEDEIVPPDTIEPGAARLRSAGSSVHLEWIAGDHAATLESEAGSRTAIAWLLDRLAAASGSGTAG
jgi:alpha-beta hydrolase superfamily lysophospholipase